MCSLPLSCPLSCLQLKGKAAIDVICNPLGKSGGAFIQQIMIIGFGSLAASTPYLGGILFLIVGLWILAAKDLDVLFKKAQVQTQESEREGVLLGAVLCLSD